MAGLSSLLKKALLSRLLTFLFAVWCGALVLSGCASVPRHLAPAGAPPVSAFPQTGFYVTLERGQTLYRVAKHYGVDVRDLMQVNHITDPSHLDTGTRIFVPVQRPLAPLRPLYTPLSVPDIRRLVGPRQGHSIWKTITVHHSGTLRGSARLFHLDHLRRRMGGLFYHFVIGNGSYSPEGAVEVGWRWKKQTMVNRPYDIQICVVGDFNRQEVSEAQFGTLTALIKMLQEDYGIPAANIRRHEDIKGKHTECPGRHFPFDRLIAELSR